MSCLTLLFAGVSWFTWRLGGEESPGENSKGRTLAGRVVMARKETKTDLFPPLLVQLLGLLFSLCRTLNIFLKLCWAPFISPSITFKDMGSFWPQPHPQHPPNGLFPLGQLQQRLSPELPSFAGFALLRAFPSVQAAREGAWK